MYKDNDSKNISSLEENIQQEATKKANAKIREELRRINGEVDKLIMSYCMSISHLLQDNEMAFLREEFLNALKLSDNELDDIQRVSPNLSKRIKQSIEDKMKKKLVEDNSEDD